MQLCLFRRFQTRVRRLQSHFVNGTHAPYSDKKRGGPKIDPPRQTVKFSGYSAVHALLRALVRPHSEPRFIPRRRIGMQRPSVPTYQSPISPRAVSALLPAANPRRALLRNFLIYVLTLVR